MRFSRRTGCHLSAILVAWTIASPLFGQSSSIVSNRSGGAVSEGIGVKSPPPSQTPVEAAIEWAEAMLKRMETLQDYSCTFVKRERLGGQLSEYQRMDAKVRHRPFSVRLKFQSPESLRGREAVWVDGNNNGKLLAKGVGFQSLFGTMSLDPTGRFAMEGNLHPITEFGMRNLTTTMRASTQRDVGSGEVNVTFHPGTTVGERQCTCIQFHHPLRRPELRYHVSRIYVDDELTLPIRFEGYTWPAQAGGEPVLIEEYTYMNLKMNNGFTERDFRL